MKNWLVVLSQSETEKYFEWNIKISLLTQICTSFDPPTEEIKS